MRKRTYRAVAVKQMDLERLKAGEKRLILGCDAAKEIWYGAWMNDHGEVLQTIRSLSPCRQSNPDYQPERTRARSCCSME